MQSSSHFVHPSHLHAVLPAAPRGGGEKCCRKPRLALQRVVWAEGRRLQRSHERSDDWSLTSTETSSASNTQQISPDGCLTCSLEEVGALDGQVSGPTVTISRFLNLYVFAQGGVCRAVAVVCGFRAGEYSERRSLLS